MAHHSPVSQFDLTTLYTRSALGMPPTASFMQRLSHLLEVLCYGWPEAHYDLRLHAKNGQLHLYFLTSAPQAAVKQLLQDLPEQEWTARPEPKRFPFAIADVVLLQRAASDPVRLPDQEATLWSVQSLGLGVSDWETLTRIAQRQPQEWLLSARWHPAQLREAEGQFVAAQVAHVTALAVKSGVTPTALPLLADVNQALLAWRNRLSQSCAQVTLTLVSSEVMPLALTHALRAWLAGQARTLELVRLDSNEASQAIGALCSLEGVIPEFSKAPQGLERLPLLYDPVELASLLPFPPAPEGTLPGLPCVAARQIPLTTTLDQGVQVGYAQSADGQRPVHIDEATLSHHLYVVGRTGMGKTTLLRNLAVNAIHQGKGVLVLDPHGDLYQELQEDCPDRRREDLILIDPLETASHRLNLFDVSGQYARRIVAMEFGEIMQRLTEDEFGVQAGSFLGPVWHQEVRMAVQWITSNPAQPGTLIDLYRFFTEKDYGQRWLPHANQEPELRAWWQNTLVNTDYQRQGSEGPSMGTWITSKFQSAVYHPALAAFFGSPHSSVQLDTAMNEQKIILVNLNKGLIGESASRFLGMVVVHLVYQAILKRAALKPVERPRTLLIGDEFQSYASQSFISLLSEGRKFGVQLALANQFIAQLPHRVRQAVLGNVGSLLSFRVGPEDALLLEQELSPTFQATDLLHLPPFTAAIRTMQGGNLIAPFTLDAR